MARANLGLKGCVSFHGILVPPAYQTPDCYKTKILVLHGDEDLHIKKEQVNDIMQCLQNVIPYQCVNFRLENSRRKCERKKPTGN